MGKRSTPSSVKKILVAEDGSKHSMKAVGLAGEMAKKWKARVYLIHVVDPVLYTGTDESQFLSVDEDIQGHLLEPRVDRACQQILDPAGDALRRVGIKDVQSICTVGNPADEIINAAKKYQVGTILS